ncbi:hypothetical protein J4760_02515 [Salinicoccus sp. ID82-1]|uniref:Uncharacterized protein n=1 Tax=Salinicoccus cyprini TaxID=2493691 RepID=A0A558AYP8_9STAP|nr:MULTISPECIES: hypothetical protein [Salinicoccus]MCG1008922.1 hypothetical protein [Salinicoccus sp. ID82-1]TVT29382.1 hypothetical protein FO441_03610 [Salinicoccus cyprini]
MSANKSVMYILIGIAVIAAITGGISLMNDSTPSTGQILALVGFGAILVVAALGFIVRLFTRGK